MRIFMIVTIMITTIAMTILTYARPWTVYPRCHDNANFNCNQSSIFCWLIRNRKLDFQWAVSRREKEKYEMLSWSRKRVEGQDAFVVHVNLATLRSRRFLNWNQRIFLEFRSQNSCTSIKIASPLVHPLQHPQLVVFVVRHSVWIVMVGVM